MEGFRMLAAIDPAWLFLAGVVVLTTVLVRMAHRRQEPRFNEPSREEIARLDNKIAILQRLLAEADETIARLEQTRRPRQ
jgi:hypothetical protein